MTKAERLKESRQKAVDDAYNLGLREGEEYKSTLVKQNSDFVTQINDQARLIEKLKAQVGLPVRKHLPETRKAVTHKFTVGGHEGYMSVGMFEDGTPGELFITMAKEGSTVGGLMDTIGCLTSIALQYGVELETLAKKFSHQRFEPSGMTCNPEIQMASSIIDYVFRWMKLYFIDSRVKPEEVACDTKP